MSLSSLRKTLSAPGLLSDVCSCFQAIKEDTASITVRVQAGVSPVAARHRDITYGI